MLFSRQPYRQLLLFTEKEYSANEAARKLVPLLQVWRPPFPEFRADEFLQLTRQVDAKKFTLVYTQILVDALELAATFDHVLLLDSAIKQLADEGQFGQLSLLPKIFDKLAAVLGRIGDHFQQHEASCRYLLGITEAFNRQMKESLTSSNNNSNNSNNSNNNNRSSNGVKEDAASNDNSGSGTKTVVKVERLGSSMNKGVRLTSLHIECLKQCILAHRRLLHLAVAEKVLSYKFDSLSGLVDSTSKAFMQYHYYAGMVYVGLDEMEKAVNTWQLVFAIPSKHLSSIQVATYKKILLAHVVASNGKKYQLPGFYSSVLLRELESLASSYISLSEALATASSYSSGSSPTDRVIKRVDEMRDTLMRDQNQGYVGKILRDLPAIQIKNISKAYSTIRVSQLVELIGYSANVFLRGNDNPSASLIAYIQQMDDPSIHVQQQGDEIGSAMVAFVPVKSTISQLPNQGPSGDTEARINIESMWVDAVKQKFEETELLKARLSQLDKHLALTREYVTNSRDSSGNV